MSNNFTFVFDLGGVLIDWNPRYVFNQIFNHNEEKANWFLNNVCTFHWNEEQDRGRLIKDAEDLLIAIHPEYKNEIRSYYGRFNEMLSGEIEGTVQILKKLKQSRHKLYALTNWSHETFPIALRRFEFLNDFDGIVVSGIEKVMKPDPKIFQIMIERYQLNPKNCVYIDDRADNCMTAAKLGFTTHHFQSPAALETFITQLR